MSRIPIVLFALATLGGCGTQQAEDTDTATSHQTAAIVAQQQAAARPASGPASGSTMEPTRAVPQFAPGQWRITGQITGIDQTGAPAALAAKIAAQRAEIAAGRTPSQTNQTCLTPAEGAAGALRLFMGTPSHYESAQIAGETVSATLAEDPRPPALPSRISYSGTITPNAYRLSALLTITSPDGARITVNSTLSGDRVGDCAGALR